MSTQKPTRSGSRFFGAIAKFTAYNVPTINISFSQGKKYLSYGSNNSFPQDLIDLYNESSTHRAIVDAKINYIYGQGLYSESTKVDKWLAVANRHGQTWNELAKLLYRDYELYDGFVIEVREYKGGLKEYYYCDFSMVRKSIHPNKFLFNEKWVKEKSKDEWCEDGCYIGRYTALDSRQAVEVEAYDPDKFQKRSFIYHINPRPGSKDYPLPTYIASMAEIMTDVEIGNYWYNEINNNFAIGGTIIFKEGAPETEDEIKQHKKMMKDLYGGSTPAGDWRSIFADDPDSAPEIVANDGNNLADRYNALVERIKQSIFTGHRITSPILFSVFTPGALGQRNEMALAYDLFNKTYVMDRRPTVLGTIKRLCKQDTGDDEMEIIPLKPVEDKIEFSEATIRSILSDQEVRTLVIEQYGLDLEETLEAKFNSLADEYMLQRFKEIASNTKDYKVLESFSVEHDSDGNVIEFDTDIGAVEQKIIKMVKDNPKITRSELAKALDMSLDELAEIVQELNRKKILNFANLTLILTAAGKKIPLSDKLPETKLMYRYVVREDAPPLKGKSRPFCREMVKMANEGQLFSREDINLIRNDMKASSFADVTDVWFARGGWYRMPNASIPFCRHIWEQVLVVK